MAANNKFKNRNPRTHPFCQDCIAKYVEAKVQDHRTADIACPGLDCRQILDPNSCNPMIPQTLFVKWCDLLCDNCVLLPGVERSYCPNKNCRALVVSECGKVKKAQCPNCKQWFCFKCILPWHAGYRCEESRNFRDPNDILFGELANLMAWANCPLCGYCVDRMGGCRIMKCRCKTSFCYDCGEIFPFGCECQKGEVYCVTFCSGVIFFVMLDVICFVIMAV